jgi:hypothetical protein
MNKQKEKMDQKEQQMVKRRRRIVVRIVAAVSERETRPAHDSKTKHIKYIYTHTKGCHQLLHVELDSLTLSTQSSSS